MVTYLPEKNGYFCLISVYTLYKTTPQFSEQTKKFDQIFITVNLEFTIEEMKL